jgi:hypothetical protein
MSFKVVSLQASSQAAELETVSLRAIIGGSMVGDAMSVVLVASTFFLSHVPSVRLQAQLDTPVGDTLFGEVNLADEYPALHRSMRALGAEASATYSGAEVAAYAAVALSGPMASSAVAARQAGDELESVLMEKASPERTKLALLHSKGAVTRLRPAVGGKAFRQCYFPSREATMGAGGRSRGGCGSRRTGGHQLR